MIPSDDNIVAAARYIFGVSAEVVTWPEVWRIEDEGLIAIYRAAFAAGRLHGMEEAELLCRKRAEALRHESFHGRMYSERCADAIKDATQK